MTRCFVTADHHFGHANIIKYCNRPFSNAEEMDAIMIERWNEVVGLDDEVWHLGDFTLGGLALANKYFTQLNGQLKLIQGSHDWRWVKNWRGESDDDLGGFLMPALSASGQFPQLYFDRVVDFKHAGTYVVLCHYAMRSWPRSYHGSIHLYGHSHGRLSPWVNSLDVGVDNHNFTPLRMEEAIRLAKEQRKGYEYRYGK